MIPLSSRNQRPEVFIRSVKEFLGQAGKNTVAFGCHPGASPLSVFFVRADGALLMQEEQTHRSAARSDTLGGKATFHTSLVNGFSFDIQPGNRFSDLPVISNLIEASGYEPASVSDYCLCTPLLLVSGPPSTREVWPASGRPGAEQRQNLLRPGEIHMQPETCFDT